jgi:hypothetical protein
MPSFSPCAFGLIHGETLEIASGSFSSKALKPMKVFFFSWLPVGFETLVGILFASEYLKQA